MARNIALAVISLAVLIVLFVGYTLIVGAPVSSRAERPAIEALQPNVAPTTQPLKIGGAVEIPAGGKIMFRRYDDKTGRPRDMFLCEDWQPVPGAKNEIRVSAPELAIMLPSGMIATISADEGQLTVDRVEQSQMRPKTGWLEGNAKIVVDRETGADRTPSVERPEDVITIALDRLEFDLEGGELKTDGRVAVSSDDFEIAGSGLNLVWNQADNRIETLTLERGEEFVLYPAAGLFGMVSKTESGQVEESEPATAPAKAHDLSRQRKKPAHRQTAYLCTLDGGLVAEQFKGNERVGGLEADHVELLFDVGGGADRFLRPRQPTSAPASRPAREDRDRLVLRWNGGLHLTPTATGPVGAPNRRRFMATGRPVVLTKGEGLVRCGQVAFHDDTQRVWLSPTAGGTVEFAMGKNLSATAESVYIDRAARIVKLIGDVELRSQRGSGAAARLSAIRCAYWGELHLAEGAARETTEDVVRTDQLESARFVGDVQVDLGEQKLTAHELDVGFRPNAGGQSLEELLDVANASGDVTLASGDSQLTCGELKLGFDLTSEHELYPRRMDAAGAVVIARGKSSVRGNRVVADLAPAAALVAKEASKQLFVIRTLDVVGEAELVDPGNHVAARGGEIAATFEGVNQLASATISGAGDEFGVVHARPYTIRGGKVELDRRAQTVHVDGPSRLALRARRSLEGQERGEPLPIEIASSQTLHVDGRQNKVRFVGDVVATSEDEQLKGDTMTLLLEDQAEPVQPAKAPGLGDLWRAARWLAGGKEKPASADDLFALRAEGDDERMRKEPVRLEAENALVTSETYEPGEATPVTHASISAPTLEVDIVNRQIVTNGLTELLMTDRRGVQDSATARDAIGAASALISRGPGQTAMRCTGRMTYSLGPDGPERRDTVVFEERVVFVHRTGKEMVNLEQMLPQVVEHPELLNDLRSQNATLECDRLETWFAVDQADNRPRRGGALTRAPLRLASLIASGNVYLRDQEDTRIREVNAAWVEFNREQGRVHVRGADRADARVYFEDTKAKQFDVHAGQRLVINLQDGTIQSDKIVGEVRRPR